MAKTEVIGLAAGIGILFTYLTDYSTLVAILSAPIWLYEDVKFLSSSSGSLFSFLSTNIFLVLIIGLVAVVLMKRR